jgi:hypothetical protein
MGVRALSSELGRALVSHGQKSIQPSAVKSNLHKASFWQLIIALWLCLSAVCFMFSLALQWLWHAI